MDTPFTPRNATKLAVKLIVGSIVAKRVENAMTDYTRFEKDDIVVDVSGMLIGWYVSDKLKPITDKMVDKTIDFVAAKREARKAKKNKTTE